MEASTLFNLFQQFPFFPVLLEYDPIAPSTPPDEIFPQHSSERSFLPFSFFSFNQYVKFYESWIITKNETLTVGCVVVQTFGLHRYWTVTCNEKKRK